MSGAHTPMYVIAAEVLCKRSIEMCDVRFEDAWNKYGEHYLLEAQAALDAVGAPDLLEALVRIMDVDRPLSGNPSHSDLVEHWEYEKTQGRGEADDRLFALAAIARATGAAS